MADPLPRPNPQQAQPAFRNMAQAMAAAPAWPMLTRTQETLLKTVWARQQLTGWCFSSQRELAGYAGVSDRQVRNLIDQLCPRFLQKRQSYGQPLLLRVKPPPDPASVYGVRQPRKSVSAPPRKSTSGDPGNGFPTNKYKYNSNELVGSAPPAPAAPPARPKPPADPTLFEPLKIDLQLERFRLGMSTLVETVVALFNAGRVTRCRTASRRFPRLIALAEAGRLGQNTTLRLVFPTGGGATGAQTVDFWDDDLLRVEFYP